MSAAAHIYVDKPPRGRQVCVTTGTGHMALMTYQGRSPEDSPSDYITIGMTVRRNAAGWTRRAAGPPGSGCAAGAGAAGPYVEGAGRRRREDQHHRPDGGPAAVVVERRAGQEHQGGDELEDDPQGEQADGHPQDEPDARILPAAQLRLQPGDLLGHAGLGGFQGGQAGVGVGGLVRGVVGAVHGHDSRRCGVCRARTWSAVSGTSLPSARPRGPRSRSASTIGALRRADPSSPFGACGTGPRGRRPRKPQPVISRWSAGA
ncbi:hypothetical protein E6P78_03155 [Streptomyces sp. A0958]|nr:hypothetical protein E6P78_03155 [Streptomyces sp. A0958]